jgi:putative membrane protein
VADGYRRLHPVTPLLRGWKWLAAAVVFGGQNAIREVEFSQLGLIAFVVAVVGVLAGLVSWWFTRFGIEGGDLRIDSGVLVRRSRRVHLERLQAVDVVRPLAARVFGVSELRLEVAGGSSSEAPLAYIAADEAQALRAELLARAAGLDATTPEAPERPLHAVPFERLLVATLLRWPVLIGLLSTVVVVGGAVLTGQWGIALAMVPIWLGLGGELYKQLVGNFGFVVAESPDGVRLRRGLLDTRSQTVPPGRVQGVAIHSPWLWRGRWVTVLVDVAGYARDNPLEGTSSGTLLPVAPPEIAARVLADVLPGVDVDAVPLQPAPRAARWLRWWGAKALAYGHDDRVFVTRSGWLHRVLTVVPHAKTQSVRLTRGPLQRRLGLASVHVDSPPGPVDAVAHHRSAAEARRIVDEQAERARTARRLDRSAAWMRSGSAAGEGRPAETTGEGLLDALEQPAEATEPAPVEQLPRS